MMVYLLKHSHVWFNPHTQKYQLKYICQAKIHIYITVFFLQNISSWYLHDFFVQIITIKAIKMLILCCWFWSLLCWKLDSRRGDIAVYCHTMRCSAGSGSPFSLDSTHFVVRDATVFVTPTSYGLDMVGVPPCRIRKASSKAGKTNGRHLFWQWLSNMMSTLSEGT